MSIDKKYKKVYRQRRRSVDYVKVVPWYKTLGKKLEEYNKRVTYGLLARILNVKRVAGPVVSEGIRSILIIRNDAIGDMVLTSPFWRTLKRHLPNVKIGVIGSFRNTMIIADDPDVDYIFECHSDKLPDVLKAAKETRKMDWDVVFPMNYHRKTKMAIFAKIFAPTAVSSMVLTNNDAVKRYRGLFSIVAAVPYRWGEGRPIIELSKMHLENTIAINVSDEEWRPSIKVDMSKVDLSWLSQLRKSKGECRYIHINLEAKNSFKEYGPEQSLKLSEQLIAQYALPVVWTSSPVAAPSLQAYLASHPTQNVHFIPTKSVLDLIAVVQRADLVISPDTSIVHIASAENKPVVALYPRMQEWLPYKVPYRLLVPKEGEPVSTIPVSDVVQAARELLSP